MNVSGEFTVNAPRDVVFRTLRDPSSFVRFVDTGTRPIMTRFQTKAEQRAVLADLAKGKVDVVIGTSRLLQKDIRFQGAAKKQAFAAKIDISYEEHR